MLMEEMKGGGTWKAEEAVPKTKPFGKLPLLIVVFESADMHFSTSNAATTTMAIANPCIMPFLITTMPL